MEGITTGQETSSRKNRFNETMSRSGRETLTRAATEILQINVGKLCNQSCHHCHVEAGPNRTEIMSWPVMERLIELAGQSTASMVDLTGGAPEMNPHFRELVTAMRGLGKEILVRCNLTILEEPGFEWLPDFYAENRVHLVCSMPCYTKELVTKQRGGGVYDKSIRALKKLNAIGYGVADHPAGLRLDLVYNPGGAFLPPAQLDLEKDYRRELGEGHGITFSNLLTLANIPIGRYRQTLTRNNELENYLVLLENAFNPATVDRVMCRNTVSVGWDGRLYDCDFNQMLSMEMESADLFAEGFALDRLEEKAIRTGEHCLGCTAGTGSSCGGALT